MSFFHHLKQLLSGQPIVLHHSQTTQSHHSSVDLLLEEKQPVATAGRLHNHRQERDLNYHNNEIRGRCKGQIATLSGSAELAVFEELPTWMSSLLVRITIEAAGSSLRASVKATDGTIID